jgi:hypothetical protein
LDGDGIVDIVVTSNTSYVGAKVSGSAFVFFLDPVPVVPPGNGGGSGVFQQDDGANGIVSIEVEDFYANVPKIHKWVPVFPAGYSGSSALQAQPNTGIKFDTGYVTGSPRLDFDVNFVKTGTDYIWILGQGATSEDNSVHVGLDGVAISSSDRITGFSTTWTWSKSTIDGPVATINIPSAGVHTVNVWMHEDGFVMDKLVLAASGSYTPTGTGPVESVQVKSLIFDPMVLAFTVEEGGTTDSQAVDLDTDTNGITAYTVSNDANWLLVTPTSGETPDMLTVHVDADGLLPGTYTATITAEAAGYAEEVVDVTLYVIAIPVPALILTPRKLNFSVEKEGTTASLGVDLNTSDGGVTTYTVSDDTGWLEVTPASGTTPGQLTVSVDATDLIPGVYTATITAEGAGYAGAIGSVTLSVTDIDTTSGGCFLSSLYFR